MVRAVQGEIGPLRTVWGVKQKGDAYSWELYFYDYGRLEREVSIERVLGALAPYAPCDLALSPKRPYFMFSIDLDAGLARRERGLDEISVYLGNPSGLVSSGLCYQLTRSGLRFDNLYYFFDARENREDIIGKVAASAHVDLEGSTSRPSCGRNLPITAASSSSPIRSTTTASTSPVSASTG